MTEQKVRVRFAPSPTGPLHIGGVRTALFNYSFAKKNKGDFLLRIEDTDQTRYVKGAEDYIIESLKWCGLEIDEGVIIGGDYGPYRQSERLSIYKQYSDQLLASGYAYYAFDTPEELESLRKVFEAGKKTFSYNAEYRKNYRNSLSLVEAEVKKLLDEGIPYVVRFKMPENEMVVFSDRIRGEVKVNTSTLDDKVLFKSDGFPTYHLANVVDDYLMKISHVIRGEEWLPSTPLHILLYKSLGWENERPEFAHMPLTLKPDGKGKLSKRDGDRLGFPVFPLQWTNPDTGEVSSGYRESGYFPEAFINILAFLGWNPGTEQEIFSLEELTEAFSLEGINKAGSRFDPEKAKWYNHQYLVMKSNEELAGLFQDELKEKGVQVEDDYVSKVVGLVKERATFISDFWAQSAYFFKAPVSYNEKTVKKRWKEDTPVMVEDIKNLLVNIEPFDSPTTEEIVKKHIEEKELGMGQVMNALRLCIVGAGMGPHLFDIMEMIGKEETISRIDKAVNILG